MKKKYLHFLFILLFSNSINAQKVNNVESNQLVFNSKTEFKISKTNIDSTLFDLEKLRIQPQYGLVENYIEGFSRIFKNQVYGFIDKKGNEYIIPQYEKAEPFNSGKALVKKFDWYFINKDGEESTALNNITEAKAIGNGVSLVLFNNKKYALIDNHYDSLQAPISKYYDAITPINGLSLIVKLDSKFGLIDINGQEKTKIEYDRIEKLSKSDDWVLIEKNKKQGLADLNGEAFVNPVYDKIEEFSMISVGAKSFINILATDNKGVRMIELNDRSISNLYQNIENFNQFGLAKVTLSQNNAIQKQGFIDFSGKEMIAAKEDLLSNFNRFGYVVASNIDLNCENSKNCTIDKLYDYKGNLVMTSSQNNRLAIGDSLFAQSVISIQIKDQNGKSKFHLLNRKTNQLITQEPYSQIKKFENNSLIIIKDEKYGLINWNGETIIKPTFESILFESEGFYGVKYSNGYHGFIDKKGKVKVNFEYNTINPFMNGVAIVEKENQSLGIINQLGGKIVPCVFKEIVAVDNGFRLKNKLDNSFLIDKKGNCIENCIDFEAILKKANSN